MCIYNNLFNIADLCSYFDKNHIGKHGYIESRLPKVLSYLEKNRGMPFVLNYLTESYGFEGIVEIIVQNNYFFLWSKITEGPSQLEYILMTKMYDPIFLDWAINNRFISILDFATLHVRLNFGRHKYLESNMTALLKELEVHNDHSMLTEYLLDNYERTSIVSAILKYNFKGLWRTLVADPIELEAILSECVDTPSFIPKFFEEVRLNRNIVKLLVKTGNGKRMASYLKKHFKLVELLKFYVFSIF